MNFSNSGKIVWAFHRRAQFPNMPKRQRELRDGDGRRVCSQPQQAPGVDITAVTTEATQLSTDEPMKSSCHPIESSSEARLPSLEGVLHLCNQEETEAHQKSTVRDALRRSDVLHSELATRREAYAALETEMVEMQRFYEKRLALRDEIVRGICNVQQHVFDSEALMQQMWNAAEEKSQAWKRRYHDASDASKELVRFLRIANKHQTDFPQSPTLDDLRKKQDELERQYSRLGQRNVTSSL